MKKFITLFTLLFALTSLSFSQVSMTIDSARINNALGVPQDSGTVIKVTGIVYGPSFGPNSSYDVFMLRGDSLGIEVYSKGTFGYTVNTGDSVEVIGLLSTYHGQAEIEPSYTVAGDTIIKLGTAAHLDTTPQVVTIVDEAHESVLIQVNNVNMGLQTGWTLPHTKHDFNVHVGTLWLYIDSFMSPQLWQLPAAPVGIYDIVGFGTQYTAYYPYNSGYSIYPRSLADFHQVNVGVHELEGSLTAAVYPNPSSTSLTITFSYDKEEAYSMKLVDLSGRTVLSAEGMTENGDNSFTFNTSNLEEGVYVLQFNTVEKSLVSKVSIER